jgi:hypothetical protein
MALSVRVNLFLQPFTITNRFIWMKPNLQDAINARHVTMVGSHDQSWEFKRVKNLFLLQIIVSWADKKFSTSLRFTS